MADKKNPDGPKQPLQEESVVARLKGASGGGPAGLTTYTGLLGRSSKEGYWLLYPTLDMSTSIEIQESDVVHGETLPPEQSPFGGLGGTRVFVRKGAQVTTTRTISRTHQAGAGDEFDLDIRVGRRASPRRPALLATCVTDGAESCGPGPTDINCETRGGSCNTCGGTCAITCGCGGTGRVSCDDDCATRQTCVTDCHQGTCLTCPTQCNQPTCTCPTQCNQGTCQVTCTCYTQCHQGTCWTNCTCDPTCARTCGGTCGFTCEGKCGPNHTHLCVFTDGC